ncbi:MAG: SprT family zinc-dependent metalloprotease [Gammaproteobacteria bacterium]
MPKPTTSVAVRGNLPEYSVRVSSRARYMQLKVSPLARVEVVVPRGYDEHLVTAFVSKHREWLHRTLAQLRAVRIADPAIDGPVPRRVELAALQETWQVEYRRPAAGRAAARSEAAAGILHLSAANAEGARSALCAWLSRRARQTLVPWLDRLSNETGLGYGSASVRAQRTRWGSCSARRHISLNRALLFLPPRAVSYLMLHELCHTVFMNHSKRYWRLVGAFEPEYQSWDARLGDGWRDIPHWAFP